MSVKVKMVRRVNVAGVILWVITILVGGILITGGWWVFFSDAFRINNIEISGNAFLTDKEIEGYLSEHHLIGKHVWFVDYAKVTNALANKPRIVSAGFEREFPNRMRLVIEEAEEFATVKLLDGRTVIIDPDGKPIRELKEGEQYVGPLICGFSRKAVECEPPAVGDLAAEREIWSGLISDPFAAGKGRVVPGVERRDILREAVRYSGALRLAGETRIDRGRVISGYDYIALDPNYDLFLFYNNRPPIVVGGFINAHDMVMEINSILDYDSDVGLWGKYDYIDLHMPEYPRGIILADLGKNQRREWSDGDEAVTVAVWKIMAEVDNRLGK
jgi:hypothetical protein